MMVVTHRNCPFRQEGKKDDARPWPGHCNSPKDCGVLTRGIRPGLNGVGDYVIVPAYTHIGRPMRGVAKRGVRPGLSGVGDYVIVPAYTHIGRPIREDPKENNTPLNPKRDQA